MSKVKYYYDSENLAYRKIKTRKRIKFGVIILFLLAAALFGFLSFIILLNTPYFETPKDRLQTREIEHLRLNYALLNKKMDQLNAVVDAIEDRDNNLYRVYFNKSAIPDSIRKEGFLGKNRYKILEGYDNSQLVINTTKRIDVLSKELAIQSKSLDDILKLADAKSDLLAAIPAIQPVRNENLKQMASGFGYRTDPFTKARKMHEGMDFTAKTGTPIYATGDGVVARADNTASGYGNHIVIRHGFGYETLYAHLSKYKARAGQRVKRGDVIGYVGSTGRSEGPHLHYEVHKDGKVVNPLNFYYGNISAVEYVVIAKLANQENQSLD
ncbi:MAG TPA: M23 family metallopeptidase [Flavobacterium sp.]|jgi:murein DD-endopeptidase MepM/ murein hydrolase activator NlpD|uniref:M23 family metallopeptidase n=1 Tax=Flavobacterium sp. TaxID=239 RepID=UPI001B6CFA87|nr:M23 family metallopeptidase [Flavobacterium sp.]MBP7182009.1 peptidoglycan DD-metalloendopeptidase family protein [Flavobacterium sp.]MBP7317001.1 peptidoglycan DD-metalloendopeptidase family protein [Flavobacterium sp.]MBP8886033.1 peptidoglycan DD-metalloendopeptidase family protein [Flavobacterium sp.]HRL71534.1 M23 family metallopeptidase [Flavobacterium sp.]HRM46756.1 M23 family metallopeptidase [Flavobacterium sp.]